MPADTAAPGAVVEQLQLTNAAAATAWLARLPLKNAAQCHALLAAQVPLLAASAIAPAAKLEVLELLRLPVAIAQSQQAQGCRGVPVPLEPKHRETWSSVVELWKAMAAGYDSLIDAMATSAPQLATQAHLICQRALRYTALAMFEHCHARHAASGSLWQQLHRLYVFSENASVAATNVNDSVGRDSTATTCAATYVHALLMHHAQPDALTNEQLDTVDRWLERWDSLVALTPDPAPHSSIPALGVGLASTKGACFAKDLPSAGVRHLHLENLSKTLRQTAAALKQQTPGQLGLGQLPRDACERLLLMLHVQWCAAGTGRTEERSPTSIKVIISPNLASAHFHLTGKAFRQPDGALTAADRQKMEMLGAVSAQTDQALASQRSVALETWVIVNQSVSGFLGTTLAKDVVNRISHHQIVGLQAPARKTMYVGVVQRLVVDEAGTIWIGLRIILGTPQAVAVRAGDGAGKYERALLMPADTARKIPSSIVLLPGWFQANRVLLLRSDKEAKIKLQALLESGPNYERATYTG